VATASDDASIKLWDYDEGELEGTMKSHTGKVNYIAYHPSGKILASCSTDMTVKLWSIETKQV
jgi:platelet-activating factor acetylhydrolase IB subunit alpha